MSQSGFLDSKKYSGFGKRPRVNIVDTVNDPVHRLREIAMKQNKNYEQRGGFPPLAPIVVPILASMGSTLISKLFDAIKEKIEKKKDQEGKGVRMRDHKTIKQKRHFLMHLVKQI